MVRGLGKRDPRLLLFTSEYPPGPGGIGTHAAATADAFAAAGWSVAVVAPIGSADATTVDVFDASLPYRVGRLPEGASRASRQLARVGCLARWRRAWRPDLIVATGERAVWFASLFKGSVPLIAVGHGTEFTGAGVRRLLTRAAFARADRTIAVSDYTEALARELGVPTPISVVPNGADGGRFRRVAQPERGRMRREASLGADDFVIVTVGSMTARKGQDLVIRALGALRRDGVTARYVVAGAPVEEERLRAIADEVGVADLVELRGVASPEEIVRLDQLADVFVLTSRRTADGDVEGYGIAIIEAALCGTPAIVASGSGAAEAVVAGETGLVVEPDDPVSLAAALRWLIDHPAERQRMADAAERRARATGTWATVMARYLEIAAEVTGSGADDAVGAMPPVEASDLRLLVVSHTPHHRAADGTVSGWGPTVRELDVLSQAWRSLTHVALVDRGDPPSSSLTYRSSRVDVVGLPTAGGDRLIDKVGLVAQTPRYARAVWRAMAQADAVHVRCPANISALALLVLTIRRRPTPRWVKYAGNWQHAPGEALSYRVQRGLLKLDAARAAVTVNGRWPGCHPHIRAFDNPCLTDDEYRSAIAEARQPPTGPPRLLYVGRLEAKKGIMQALEVAAHLIDGGDAESLVVVGDGPDRSAADRLTRQLGVGDRVQFAGWVPQHEVAAFYRSADFLIFPSATEGFPKVVAEAMAHGVIPITSDVSAIPQVLRECRCGTSVAAADVAAYVEAVRAYRRDPSRWAEEIAAGRVSAERFTYSRYLESVATLFREEYGIALEPGPVVVG